MALEVGATLLIVGLAASSAGAAPTEPLPSSPLERHSVPARQHLIQHQADGALLSLQADGAKDEEAAPEEPAADGSEPAPSPGAKAVAKPGAGATEVEGEAGEEAESDATENPSEESPAADAAGAS